MNKIMTQELVSIITPSYNCSDYIAATIEAIQRQTYSNWELLITDDCSTDNSVSVIEKYASSDSRIRLLRLDKNSGAGAARNNSIALASGRYIAFCDSDDVWLPTKLERQIEFLRKTGATVGYSSYLTCDEAGEVTGMVVAYREISYKEMLNDDSLGFLTCIYDVKTLGKIYMPTIRKRQDWGLKILLLQRAGKAKGIIEPLAIYRIRKNSLSNKKISLVKYNVSIYKEVLHYNPVRAWSKFIIKFMPHYIAKKIRLRIINR
jgi:glycosyltransferase involved in cell wall biosynthesis